MRIVRVTGTLTATVKDDSLSTQKLLIVAIEDAAGKVLSTGQIAADTCGAGIGDLCVMVEGSSARIASSVAGKPIDACLIAIIDQIQTAK